MESTLKGKNLLLWSKFFPLRADFIRVESNMMNRSARRKWVFVNWTGMNYTLTANDQMNLDEMK